MTRNKKTPDKPDEGARPADDTRQPARALSADLQAHIGVRLKAFYDSVLSEPIPDRFAELLDRLDTAEPSKQDGAGATTAAEVRSAPDAVADSEAPANSGAGTDVRS